MARVTVDDCMSKIENPFDLTLITAKRAYQIARGSRCKVSLDQDKPVVLALREISEGLSDEASIQEEEQKILEKLREMPDFRAERNKDFGTHS